MLVNVTYPGVLGGKSPKTNSGHLNVKGWEFTIGWRDQIKDFSYYANFNIGDTKLLQKSEMRKDIVIELSYKGFG